MAAIESFNWFIQTNIPSPSDEVQQTIIRQRDYLLTLRNEDERQRYVEEAYHELREVLKRSKR